MKRAKPKLRNTEQKSSKDTSTQTENLNNFIEIAKLEEQVKILRLENDVLRKHLQNQPDDVSFQAIFKSNVKKSTCKCKGNCSSRCGCIKNNNKCNPLCKCDDKICQNQENKENFNETNMDIQKKSSKEKNEEFEKDTITNNLEIDIDYIDKNVEEKKPKKKKNKKAEKDKEQTESNEKVIFDPMKPQRQLLRTPPSHKNSDNTLNIESQPDSLPNINLADVFSSKDYDIQESNVDWEKYTAQLIPCKKCNRTFLPERIQKHETCCKKI